ncbi:MAG: hypothetical protein L6R41_005685 [Letrouitia leprolyta]|nr:MAG: hypothetical protein L6R41_005685 [Letrouitia leprolyta]
MTIIANTDGQVRMDTHQETTLRLLDRIRNALTTPDSGDVDHAKLLADVSRLQLAIETPLETIYRIGHQTWQNACVKIALELGVFDFLVARDEIDVDAQELAETCKADAVFLVRIMRVIVALGLCAESKVEKYKANSKTKIMTIPQGISSFKAWFDIFTQAAAKLPEYARSQNYQNPTESTNSAFVYATGSEFWTYLKKTPTQSQIFNDFMATRRQGRPNWYDTYPIEQELSSPPNVIGNGHGESNILLVDVGGNRGHDLINLRNKHPGLQGRMILQDLPDVIAHTFFDQEDGIEAVPHDFFQRQPIQHARAYNFRAIFHDWPDSSCRQILIHTAAAMKPDYSKLLISEFVLPDSDTALFPATLDIQMMGLHAGMERSERQWRNLLDSAGLEVVKIWQVVKGGEAVIEARLKVG